MFDDLLDDRALIQIRTHEVSRRPDDFDAAGVRLVIGLRAFEAGQEGVVDIDRPAAQRAGSFIGEDLHITRQDHEFSARALDEFEETFFLCALRIGRDRQMMKGNAAMVGDGL